MIRSVKPQYTFVYHRGENPEVRMYKKCDIGLVIEAFEQVVTRSAAARPRQLPVAKTKAKAKAKPKAKAQAKATTDVAMSSACDGIMTRSRTRLMR